MTIRPLSPWTLLVAFFLLSGVGVAVAAPAVQESFTAQTRGGARYYEYSWRDSSGTRRVTTFAFNPDDVERGRGEFRRPDLEGAGVRQDLVRVAKQIAGEYGCTVELGSTRNGVSVQLSGRGLNGETARLITSRIGQAREDMHSRSLRDDFYEVVDGAPGSKLVRPSYSSVAERYAVVGKVVAKALTVSETGEKVDQRSLASRALDFIQSIPYSAEFSNGAGFQTPLGMFEENRGDCDTKGVALQTILHGMGIGSILLAVPGHVFIGVAVPPAPGDQTISHGGWTYVVGEPSGVGYPLGRVDPSSAQAGAPEVVSEMTTFVLEYWKGASGTE